MIDHASERAHDARWSLLCELYAMDALDEQECGSFERHAVSCPMCARILKREAELELALREAASSAPVLRRRPFIRSPKHLLVAAAVAACLALVIAAFQTKREPPVGAQPEARGPSAGFMIACPDEAALASCRALASRHGFRIEYPAAAEEIPRYEQMVAQTSQVDWQGDSLAP